MNSQEYNDVDQLELKGYVTVRYVTKFNPYFTVFRISIAPKNVNCKTENNSLTTFTANKFSKAVLKKMSFEIELL